MGTLNSLENSASSFRLEGFKTKSFISNNSDNIRLAVADTSGSLEDTTFNLVSKDLDIEVVFQA